MGNWDHKERYADLPVFRFDQDRLDPDGAAGLAGLPAAGAAAWCVSTWFDDPPFKDVWDLFRASVDTTEITALLVGNWCAEYREPDIYPVLRLVEAADAFPRLESLFLGEITAQEVEISWIAHGDVSPIFHAFPGLRRFEIRGSDGLTLEPIESDALRVLRFESGGLPGEVARAVAASDLPNLEHLDLWLGDENYGGSVGMADLDAILTGERFPALRHLGLMNAGGQDLIAEALASAPVVARLESLSLAMGTLTDAGAEALLSGQPLTHLRKLDLRHHFLSEPMTARVAAALPGTDVDLGDRQDPRDDWFYVEVSE